jgi:hypothetical protein
MVVSSAWGFANWGGDISSVSELLSSGVAEIFATERAFAALKSDGSVVTWGPSGFGGDSSNVASSLTGGVVRIYSTSQSFVALKADGSVVSWGSNGAAEIPENLQDALSNNVYKIFATNAAFAALRLGGSVVTWGVGPGSDQGDTAAVLELGVINIIPNYLAFVSYQSNWATVGAWGDAEWGGDITGVDLTEVQDISPHTTVVSRL